MRVGAVTTPFGRRSITLALVKGQIDAAEIPPSKAVDKWKVYRDACEARAVLGLRDRALAVLSALLSFHPETMLSSEKGLIVFPSNEQLAARANGIAGTTLRENLALLVEAGLISRKDSPNGKRYARKARDGSIESAFGFSLAPLVARAEELAKLAQTVAAERHEIRLLKEDISLCRRDIRKLLSAAIEEGAPGNWAVLEDRFIATVASVRLARHADQLRNVAAEMQALHETVVNELKRRLISSKSDGNGSEFRHHIQNSNTKSYNELEPSQENGKGGLTAEQLAKPIEMLKPFPLSMVMRACPQAADYGGSGGIAHWRDLMAAAVVIRSTLGISPSAYQQACEVMGPENAATAVACILERAEHINSPGGYLRDLTRRASQGEFSLGPMLMALMRGNASVGKAAG